MKVRSGPGRGTCRVMEVGLFCWGGPRALSPALRTTDSILEAEGGHAASEEQSKAVGPVGRGRAREAASAAGGQRAMLAAMLITLWAAE